MTAFSIIIRMGNGLLALVITLASPCIPFAAAQESQAAQTPKLRLEIPRRGDDKAGPLDWVLEKVPSGSDEWKVESWSEEASRKLKELAAALEASSLTPETLRPIFAERFRGVAPNPHPLDPVLRSSNLEAWEFRAEARSEPLEFTPWLESFRDLRGRFAALSRVRFKVFGIDGSSSEGGSTILTRVLLEMDGPDAADASRSRLQVRTTWKLRWERRESTLRLRAMDLESFHLARARRRSFRDVTLFALGETRAYREQLRFGVEVWRRRIDSASGIDVYGHQGIAVGDFDGDGRDDFYVPQPAGLPDRLFRNRGDGRFEEVAETAGVAILDPSGGALFVDLDNDGDLDLLVATALEMLVFENVDGSFRRHAKSGLETAMSRSSSTLGVSAADHDLDGDLDLYVFSYIFWAGAGSKLTSSYPYPYHDANNGAPNFLFRNDGGFRFSDVTAESGLGVNNRRFSLAASWSDYDDDGDPDLYVANDFGKNNLYRNDGGKFLDVAEALGVEDTGNGMSVTWEDVDNDGHIDLYVGNMWSSAGNRLAFQSDFADEKLRPLYLRMARGNSLFRNLGDGRFEDITARGGASFGRWSWSAQFLDVEGDGREDLYVCNGFISNEIPDDL